MAETIIHLVLNKLADAVVKETLFLYGIRNKVEKVQRHLTWIQSFLKDADTKRHKNEMVKTWVHEVKEVGYLIEDALDEFFIKVDGGTTFQRTLLMKIIARHKLGTSIDKIQQRITEISANTAKYGIEGLKDDSTVASSNVLVRPPMIPDIDETDVIGFEVDMRTIVEHLTDTHTMRRAVISVVGAGGSGKTTLAKEVYNRADVKSHFSVRLWLTISQDYSLKDILIKMLDDMGQPGRKEPQTREEYLFSLKSEREEYLAKKVYISMENERYLVVLDDVWSSDPWTELQAALPNSNNSTSRVLVTTRFLNIVKEADAKNCEIKCLDQEESQQLLLKKIFSNPNECPGELVPLVPQFAKKCAGSPLGLVVLGGFLSTKPADYNVWYRAMQNINWYSDGTKCMGIISTSYDDLPIHLKTCFMYFAIFPEDYQINATTLIRLWIAEGFIAHDESRTMEDIAESYLEELVQRCMVQVTSRTLTCKIKYCHIHDLLRKVAIEKVKEDNFLTVLSNNGTRSGGSNSAGRMALHNCSNDTILLEQASTNLRSLLCFGDNYNASWKRFGMLRVLNMPQARSAIMGNGLKALTGLRYFEIREYDRENSISPFSLRRAFIPAHLIHIKRLQTVKILFSEYYNNEILPRSFWENKLLRHVEFSDTFRWYPVDIFGPPSSADLQNLLTLKGVTAREEWVEKLPHFPHLRKLALATPQGVHSKPIVNSLISNLQDLVSLSLTDNDKSGVALLLLRGTTNFGNLQNLCSLFLSQSTWPKQYELTAVDCGSVVFPLHLSKLNLHTIKFEEDPMPQLEKMRNLKVLELDGYMDLGDGIHRRMICSRRGFTCLQRLVLYLSNVEEWKIEDGAMPLLNQLKICYWSEMKLVPDLQYLTNLRKLKVREWSSNSWFKNRLQGDDQWKIKHISSVIFKEVILA